MDSVIGPVMDSVIGSVICAAAFRLARAGP
jgi:hypothetical protein